ncbi:MAG: lysophospholipase [Candidatus Helarchaeota archaeon]
MTSEKLLEINGILQKMRINPIANNGYSEYFECKSGDNLFYRVWKAENQTRIVIGIHGMAAHSEYYIQVADQLIDKGISVFALDLKHHGHSTGKIGDLKNFQELIDQVHEFILKIKNENSGIPIFLMGISMGGCLAINYSIKYPEDINGLILMAPAVKVNLKFSFYDILKLPILGIVYLVNKSKPIISIEKRSLDLGTRNPLRKEYDKNDEYRIKKVSVRYLLQINSWVKKAFKNRNKISHPVIIFQGSDDKLVSPESVEQFYKDLNINDKSLIILKGAYHTLFSDPAMENENGWKKMSEWILAH